MILLPETLLTEVRLALEPHLKTSSLEEALQRCSDAVRVLFAAQDVLLIFQTGGPGAKRHFSYGSGSALFREVEAASLFTRRWTEAVHPHLIYDLERKLTAVSHSAFSWPYPQLSPGDAGAAVPRDYTLLLPFSSDLVVRHAGEKPFSGYLALFFAEFPSLSETAVQMIVGLPELFSHLAAGYLRHALMLQADDLGMFCHDVKRFLLLNQEFISIVRQGSQRKAKQAVAGLEKGVLNLLHRANTILINDRILYGRLVPQPLVIDFDLLVRESAAQLLPLFEGAGVQLEIESGAGGVKVEADPALFPSVVQNLVHNALKHSSRGSIVQVRTTAASGRARVTVADSGTEISDEEAEKLFERRFRGGAATAVQGEGLGLYVVGKIVEAHQGSTWLEREPGGKQFVVELPAAAAADRGTVEQ